MRGFDTHNLRPRARSKEISTCANSCYYVWIDTAISKPISHENTDIHAMTDIWFLKLLVLCAIIIMVEPFSSSRITGTCIVLRSQSCKTRLCQANLDRYKKKQYTNPIIYCGGLDCFFVLSTNGTSFQLAQVLKRTHWTISRFAEICANTTVTSWQDFRNTKISRWSDYDIFRENFFKSKVKYSFLYPYQ